MDLLTTSDIIDRLTEFIRQNGDLFKPFDNVYLFGSVLNDKTTPNDIDVLLIYSGHLNKAVGYLDIIAIRVKQICGLPAHLTVLSFAEEKETEFLKRIGAHLRLK